MASCVVLLSGGLDSILAARVLMEQGIHVTGVNFAGAYCPVRLGEKSNAEKAAEQLGIELVRLPIDQEFIEMVKAPRYGRGKNMNPCIDCHILMVRRAWEFVQARSKNAGRATRGAAVGRSSEAESGDCFVATGEVLGQRPMSQNRQALAIVARRSGAEGYLLRPLSARLLKPTIPEQKGVVDREKLLDIQGRGRQRQMELAAQYGITDYPAPAGGCLLTDAGYAARLREALAHREDSVAMVELLSFGRHFRLPSGSKVIVGRNRLENEELLQRVRGKAVRAVVVDAQHLPGPVALLLPSVRSDESDRLLAARLCARYSDRRKESRVTLLVGGERLEVEPASAKEADALLVRSEVSDRTGTA